MVPTSKSSKVSEKHSWRLSLSRKSIGRVHSPFSLHTRVANVLEEDYQNAFDPNARAVKVWEYLLLLSLLVEAFLVPYFLAFQPEAVETVSTLFTVFIACEGVFAVDLYVQAHTGYYSDGNLIRDKKLTVRSYIRSFQFALDIIAILPYQVFVVIYPKLVAKLLLLKLLRWSRIPHFVSSLDEFFAKYFVALKLLKVLASTVYLAHVQACIRFNFHHYEIIESSDPSHSLHSQYLASMFWSVGIMTGLFEGELPHHSIEFLFTILVALCGFSMFTTLCATIFVISKCESGQTEAMEARINQLVHVLSFHRVPKSQQTQAIEYLKRYYTDTESHDRETSKLLCPSIANDIQVELLKATIADISIFEGCNDQFIVAMTSLLEMVAFPAQTVLFSTGDDGDAMYVVHSGVLAIVINSVMVREIRKGSCFGELRRQLLLLGMLLFMIIHIVTCIHFGISYFEGFNPHEEEAWISPINLCLSRFNWTHLEDCNGSIFEENSDFHELQAITFLEYSRSLYYAVGVLASPGKSVEPTTDVQLIAALILMLSGFLITAIVVDNVQKRFTASAFEQKEFFATSTRIQLFLRRQNAPLAIHHRVKSFLDYWWSSHRGAVIGELLADLPRTIRLNLLKSICLPVLQTLSLLQNVRSVQDKLEEIMVENAKFILYGQGEIVYRHGDSVVGMFFLLEGEVYMVEKGETSREIPRGSFFGTAVLTQQERGEGYTEHVSANSGCILLLVSRDQLQAMEALFPTLKEEFLALEQRLQGNKLATMRAKKSTVTVSGMSSRMLHNLISVVKESLIDVHDPDSQFVLAWETWVFVVMTVQWALVMLQSCYLMGGRHKVADALLIFLELSFVLDIQIRSRLGYYEFGNKIMDPVRIKRKYLRSGTLVLDIIALIPLFIVNLALPFDKRWGLLNVNKLLRLFKVPKQFHPLETKYLKHTTELRLFKLLYYTFILSHFLGCLWFNFASRVAVPSFAQTSCILYRLSRGSMELVFARYPKWKQKVLRIANIRREQERLLQLSAEEQRRGMATITGMMLSRADIMNERAERLKEDLDHARLKRSNSERFNLISTTLTTLVKRFVHNPLADVVDGIIHGVPVQTRFHLIWLRFMVFCTMYVAVMIPYQLSMDAMNRVTLVATTANAVGLLCEVAFILDIWFSWHVEESPTSLELYEQNLRSVYKKQRMLFDVIAAIPFYGVLFVFNCRPWMKLLRCVKIVNVMGYLDEINRRSVANELTRFWHVWIMYLLVIHWVACSYLAVATEVGFGTEWESWLPSQELEISDPKNPSSSQLSKRFLRGLFFATTAFVKKARNIKPETAVLYTFQITMSFIGLITMSFVIGELASLFISYIGLEVDFRKNHIAVELYLARLRVSDRLKTRTYAFMTSLWSSHAGVNYDELLEEMPRPIRAACVLHASKEPLDWFVMKVFTPICWDGKSAIEAFTLSLAEQLRFEGYPRDENVVTEGSIVRAMYFVTKGHLNMQSNSLLDHPVGLGAGSYFGERGLLGFSISAYTVTTHWMFALIRTNILKRSTLWRALNTRWKNIGEQRCYIPFKRFVSTNQ
ncbi:hypothetical protein PC119_g18951 [Phytophthora cactorum]|nr:hypothetical protein PC119_g18951 [Phytophthora cactorum]